MADVASLLASQLINREQELFQQDPFGAASGALGQLRFPLAGKHVNPKEAALAQGMAAALSGLLGGFADARVKPQIAAEQQRVNQALRTPEGLQALRADPQYGMTANVAFLQRQLEEQERDKRLERELEFRKRLAPIEREAKIADIEATTPALVKREKRLEQIRARGRGALSLKDVIDLEQKDANTFKNDKDVRRFVETQDYFNAMLQSYNDESGASDIAFVNGVMRIFDPQSVVRREEQRLVIETQGKVPAAVQEAKRIFESRGRLTQESKNSLLRLASRLYDQRQGTFEKTAKAFEVRALTYGGRPAVVNPLGHAKKSEALFVDFGINTKARDTYEGTMRGKRVLVDAKTNKIIEMLD